MQGTITEKDLAEIKEVFGDDVAEAAKDLDAPTFLDVLKIVRYFEDHQS